MDSRFILVVLGKKYEYDLTDIDLLKRIAESDWVDKVVSDDNNTCFLSKDKVYKLGLPNVKVTVNQYIKPNRLVIGVEVKVIDLHTVSYCMQIDNGEYSSGIYGNGLYDVNRSDVYKEKEADVYGNGENEVLVTYWEIPQDDDCYMGYETRLNTQYDFETYALQVNIPTDIKKLN